MPILFPQLESVVGENGGNLEVEFISLYQSLQKVVRMGLELNPWIEVITVQKKYMWISDFANHT